MTVWKKLWSEIPIPTSGKKADLIAWIINFQQRSILRWQALFIGITVTFITYVVTEKLVWPFFPFP